MSEANKVQVEFGGGVDSSYDSSVDHVKKGLAETASEYGHFAKAVAEHLAVTAVAHTAFEHRSSILSAGLTLVRVAASRALSGVAPVAAGALSAFGLVYGAVKTVSLGLYLLEKASGAAAIGLGKFSILEDLSGRLRSFTGSTEAARQKLGELATTFRGTPVAVPDAVDAYRSARTADNGSGELSSSKGLTLLGDVAASSNNNIKDVSGAVGKFYDDLRSGQPIKESADKLREMGIISGDTRQMLDRLLASGRSGPEVWAALRTSLESSTGAMKEQQQTLSGLQKSVQEAKDQLYTSFAKGSVDFEKDKLTLVSTILQKVNPVAEEAGDLYGGAKNAIAGLIKKILELTGVLAARDKALANGSALKTFTDGVIAAGIGLGSFIVIAAAAAVGFAVFGPASIGLVAAAAAATAFGLAFAAVPALLITAGVAVYAYALHLKAAADAQLAYANGSQQLVNGLEKERTNIASVTDKVKFLADAYAALRKAREDAANAKTPEDRHLAEVRATAIRSQIQAAENNSGLLQRQRQQAQTDVSNAKSTPERRDAQKRVDALTERINRGDRATDRDLAPSEERAKIEGELSDRANKPKDDEEAAQNAEREARDARIAANEKRQQAQAAEEDLEQSRVQNQERIERRRELARQALDPEAKSFITASMAGVESANDGKTQQVYRARSDAKAAELEAQKKEDAATAARKKVTDAAEKKAKEDKEAADKKAKEAREQQVGSAEADAEAKLAAVQTEGVQRTRDEYEINRQLLETKLRIAEVEGDTAKMAKLRADYYRDQQAQAKKEEEAARTLAADKRALDEATATRKDAADKRQLEQDAKAGKITDQQRRDGENAILERQKQRINDDAAQKDKEVAEAKNKGDDGKVARLQKEAVELRARADAIGGQQYDLLHPDQRQQRQAPIADELRRIGGGGNAYYGTGQKDDAAHKIDETNKRLERIEKVLEQGNKLDRRGRVL